jgi:hypothetical protein
MKKKLELNKVALREQGLVKGWYNVSKILEMKTNVYGENRKNTRHLASIAMQSFLLGLEIAK